MLDTEELRKAAATELLRRQEAHDHLLEFVLFTIRKTYNVNWTHKLICDALERFERAVVEEKDPRLMIRMPPRGGKSEIISRKFPAWFIGRNPTMDVIATSYSGSLAGELGGEARDTMASQEFGKVFEDVELRSDARSTSSWKTKHGGHYLAAGVGEGITGQGAHCFPAGTIISTERGCIPIENLQILATPCKVWAYDEPNQKLALKSIQAICRRQSPGLYRITSASGRVVEATADHPFWTTRGYVRADSLAPGDRLLCHVQDRGSATGLRSEQEFAERPHGFLLLKQMLAAASESATVWGQKVLLLWGRVSTFRLVWGGQEPILFTGLHGRSQGLGQKSQGGSQALDDLCRVRPEETGEHHKVTAGQILRDSLQGQGACQADARPKEPGIYSWTGRGGQRTDSRQAGISDHKTGNPGARWLGMRSLLQGWLAPRSPSKFGPEGQPLAKSGQPMPIMSPDASRASAIQERIEEDHIRSVDALAPEQGGTTVYDLQVEGTHNFFANGFLVHNCLIIDDPYKDAKEAWSETIRKNVWDWFTTTSLTRLMPGGGIIVVLTSWHEDGLDNKLLRTAKDVGETWEVIDIPAIMEAGYVGRHPEDYRKPGESYWPERWPIEKLLVRKARMRAYAWNALYQQRAAPETGGIIKRSDLKLWQVKPPLDWFDEIVSSWDLAFKGSADSSRVARHIWGFKGADAWLLHREAEVMEFTETLQAFDRWHNFDGSRKAEWPTVQGKLVEDKANGPALQSTLKNKIPGLIMLKKEIDKVGALRSVAWVFRGGNVWLPDPEVHPWAEDVIEELVKFPNTAYNDDTDCCSQALRYKYVPDSIEEGGGGMADWEL